MVVFTCSSCGESLKKNQVEKHCQFRCRNCQYLTCMDCNTEFWGNDYEKHTKCVTEDQRYGGKDYVPKANSNKGEVKQESWIEHVKQTISTTQVPRHIAVLMEQLINFENIPRKKNKFENFVKNSLKLRDPKIIGQVWELFAKAQENSPKTPNHMQNSNTSNSEQSPNCKDLPTAPEKRKNDVIQPNDDAPSSNKKRKSNDDALQDAEPEISNGNDQRKFKWTKVVKKILRERADHCMPLKKLQKKFLVEYRTAQSDCSMGKDELKDKLQMKISKCAKLVCEGDQIMLKE